MEALKGGLALKGPLIGRRWEEVLSGAIEAVERSEGTILTSGWTRQVDLPAPYLARGLVVLPHYPHITHTTGERIPLFPDRALWLKWGYLKLRH